MMLQYVHQSMCDTFGVWIRFSCHSQRVFCLFVGEVYEISKAIIIIQYDACGITFQRLRQKALVFLNFFTFVFYFCNGLIYFKSNYKKMVCIKHEKRTE